MSLKLQNLIMNFSGEVSNEKNHDRSLELGTRDSRSPEVGDLLVCQFFWNENLELNDSVRLQNHPGYAFLLMKSAEDQFQSSYQPGLRSKFRNALFLFGYLT